MNLVKFIIVFTFLIISVLIDTYELNLLFMGIGLFLLYQIDKLENNINFTKNIKYLMFNLSSLAVYMGVAFILIENENIGFNFIFATLIFFGRAILIYSGTVDTWKKSKV